MGDRRVVVTGLGIISALGHTAGKFWAGLRDGQPGIRTIQAVDCSQLRFQNGAEVPDYVASAYFDDKQAGMLDRFAQFAVIAAREAMADAGMSKEDLPEQTAVITGSCVGGQCSMDNEFVAVYKNGLPRVNPMTIPRVMANSGASCITMEFGITGPSFTISTACSSSAHAIGQAFWMVRNGSADVAITGGSEAVFSFGLLKAWEAMRVVTPDTCRPFSKDRRGLILGEGGAMLILEPLERAVQRGARIYAEVAGFGMSSDAHHITQPSATGAARAMCAALRDGGIATGEVRHINAHGTGTQANDSTETEAIRQTFLCDARNIRVNSTKSMHGHTLGAAGAMEAAATILAMHHRTIPPTANFTEADPLCNLDVVHGTARELDIPCALSNSFAFGGLNAVLAFRAAE